MKIKLSIILIFLFTGVLVGQERYVMPVDDAKKDASFLEFRTKLIDAIERRDAKFVLGILDPNVKLSFGGDEGVADFKRMWKINDNNSKFWDTFLPVIKNGGSFDKPSGKGKRLFMAPYLFSSFPEDLDAFEHWAIFGNNVNLRERPATDAPIVASLSYNVVKVDHDGSVRDTSGPADEENYSWYKITTLGGKKGFVKSEFVRSSVDFRAGFEKKRGKWKLVFFLAGD